MAEPTADREPSGTLPGGRAGLPGALRHPLVAVLLLGLVYVGLTFTTDPRGFLGTDTGGKVATLEVMHARGDLDPDVGYWAAPADPDGLAHPLYYTTHLGDRWVNVTTLPMLLAGSPLFELGGYRAALLLPIAGALLCALAAVALARRLGAREPMMAFWAVGLATPVAVYALDFWEHTLGLAAMAWGIVALVDVAEGRAGWRAALGAGALFGVGATMRTEALVYGAVATAAVCLVLAARDRLVARAVGVGAAVVGGVVPLLVANDVLERVVLGGPLRAGRAAGTAASGGSELTARLEEAVRTSVDVNLAGLLGSAVIGVAIVAALGVGTWGLATGRLRSRLGYELLGSGGLLLVARIVRGLGFLSGMLIASPLAVVGLALAWRRAGPRRLTIVAVTALPVVWFTEFLGGAGPQWGGRYLLCSGLLLAVVGVVESAALPGRARWLVAATALVVTASGVAWLGVRSREVARTGRALRRRRRHGAGEHGGALLAGGGRVLHAAAPLAHRHGCPRAGPRRATSWRGPRRAG